MNIEHEALTKLFTDHIAKSSELISQQYRTSEGS